MDKWLKKLDQALQNNPQLNELCFDFLVFSPFNDKGLYLVLNAIKHSKLKTLSFYFHWTNVSEYGI